MFNNFVNLDLNFKILFAYIILILLFKLVIKMKIILNKVDKLPNLTNKILLEKNKTKSKILPSFTKKIFSSVSKI